MSTIIKLMSKKIKLIYISSNGRSGSTLLDMLIGIHSKCFTLGEFQVLPIDYLYNTQPCGCNRRVDSCDFWADIIEQNKNIITEVMEIYGIEDPYPKLYINNNNIFIIIYY